MFGRARLTLAPAVLVALVLVAAPNAGLAQAEDAGPQRTTATYDDWLLQCLAKAPAAAAAADKAAAATDAVAAPLKPSMSCEINQTFTVRDTGATLAKLAIGKVAGVEGTKAVAITPVGVYLPDGLVFKIDGGEELKAAFTYCSRDACVGEMALADAAVEQLKVAKAVTMTFTTADRKPLTINVSPKGFANAYSASVANQAPAQ